MKVWMKMNWKINIKYITECGDLKEKPMIVRRTWQFVSFFPRTEYYLEMMCNDAIITNYNNCLVKK